MPRPLATFDTECPPGTTIESSTVVAFDYTHDGDTVHVICGPNQYDSSPCIVTVETDGDILVESGFAYVYMAHSAAARPNVHTPRTGSVGSGSAWMAQVHAGMNDDYIYFIEGNKVDVLNTIDTSKSIVLDSSSKHTFTELLSSGSFRAETPYSESMGADAHAEYVRPYCQAKGWPAP